MQAFPFDSQVSFDEVTGDPIYDRAISSQPLRELIRDLFSTGVMPNPSNNLQVSAGTDGMTIQVQAGYAVVDGGLCHETEVRTLEVTASDNTYDRIDTVVLRWNENVDVRTADLYIVAGTPSANPVRPTLQRDNSIYEIGLADVFVTKRVATITNDKITDTRYETERCGIVSSVSEWDTTTIYQQIQAELAGFKSNEEAEFDEWFNEMKDQLSEDAAGHLQNEIDDINDNITNGTCVNLINSTAQTLTKNGVTFTNNGDGTYTVNGTASADATLTIIRFNDFSILENKKLVGCPVGGNINTTYSMYITCYKNSTFLRNYVDNGNGVIVSDIPSEANAIRLNIIIRDGYTANNLLFKPMLTTDLNAKYADYVPYTGDSGRLNEDVAEMYVNKQNKTDNALATSDKTIVGAINGLNNGINNLAKYIPAFASLGRRITDALDIDTVNFAGDANMIGIVSNQFTQSMPSSCAYGVREVFWCNPTAIIIQITGVASQGGTFGKWGNFYNGTTWTGWERL